MTSACTTFGAMPLLLASGAGSESLRPIGLVIVFGVTISAALTLFVVPALHVVLAKNTRSPQYVARMISSLRRGERKAGAAEARPEPPSQAARTAMPPAGSES
jgi:hypothetical protein